MTRHTLKLLALTAWRRGPMVMEWLLHRIVLAVGCYELACIARLRGEK
jgi:hypothetical protein